MRASTRTAALLTGVAVPLWSWLLIAVIATVVLYSASVVGLVVAGRGAEARAVAGFVPDCVVLFRRLIADERVPRRSKPLDAGARRLR
jgi:hypothetical protein